MNMRTADSSVTIDGVTVDYALAGTVTVAVKRNVESVVRVPLGAVIAAIETLVRQGYTYHGEALWKPPVSESPDFNLCDVLRADRNRLRKGLAEAREGLDEAREMLLAVAEYGARECEDCETPDSSSRSH